MSSSTAQESQSKSHENESINVAPWVVLLTRLLDDCIKIPGTKYRIGLDGLLGLIPFVGDAVTAAFGYWMVREAKRLGVPATDRAKIVGHYVLDVAVGFVPLLGDALDFAYKANRMSLDIIETHLKNRGDGEKRERIYVDAEVKDK